jgi:hypothetical protein
VTKEPWALLVVFVAALRAFEDYRDMEGRVRFAERESRNGGVITMFGMFADRRAAIMSSSWRQVATTCLTNLDASSGFFHLLHNQTTTTSPLPIEVPGSVPKLLDENCGLYKLDRSFPVSAAQRAMLAPLD